MPKLPKPTQETISVKSNDKVAFYEIQENIEMDCWNCTDSVIRTVILFDSF